MQVEPKHVLATAILGLAWLSALHLDPLQILAPASWAIAAVCIHLAYVVLVGWPNMDVWARRGFMWGVCASVLFLNLLTLDTEFTVRAHTERVRKTQKGFLS